MNHIGIHGDHELTDPDDRPRVLAFGGGKGGAGRSTLCAEVARSIARRDKHVLCLDADWNCPTLDTLLHLEQTDEGRSDPSDASLESEEAHVRDFARATQTEGIELASIASSRRFPFVRPQLSPRRLMDELHELDVDWVLIDLPPGFDPFAVGLFVLSDIPLMVSSPEPISIRKTTQFLRTSLFHALGHHPGATDVRDTLQELLYDQPLELDVNTLLEDAPNSVRAIVEDSIEAFETYLAVNFVREGAEEDLGYVLCHAWHEEIGLYPRFLTPVDYEDRRWFYHRRSTGTGAVRGEETRSRDIEKLTQSMLDITSIDEQYPRPIPRGDDLHPALRLGISPECDRNRVRQHCRRLWEGYGREEAIELVFRDSDKRDRVTEELETLYREVLTVSSDEFSATPPSEASSADGTSSPRAAVARDRSASPPSNVEGTASTSASERDEGAATLDDGEDYSSKTSSDSEAPHSEGSETENTTSDSTETDAPDSELAAVLPGENEPPGRILQALRRRASISLQELSLRTNIGLKYVTAIEDGDIDVLPRPVYLKGYLQEIARLFDTDPDALVEEYFQRLDRDLDVD